MKNWQIKLSLFLNYFVFAILLNSVGAVILQMQRYFDVTKSAASILEGFKDLPIAIASFLLASLLPKYGLKKSMLTALAMVTIGCFFMPFSNDFWHFKILYLVIGVSFALIKVPVFATMGLITENEKEHSSLMSTIEGLFMVGVLVGSVFFSLFIDDNDTKSDNWLNAYWALGGLSFLAFLLMLPVKLDESKAKIEKRPLGEDFMAMLRLIIVPLVLVFILSIFLFVLIEQSIQTWTPTFYKEILKVPASMSIQAGAVLAGCFAAGRFLAGFFLKKIHWLRVLTVCLIGCAALVLLSLPLSEGVIAQPRTTWFNAPLVAYIFPLMGIFLSPIYPTINSVILSSLPKHSHSSMSGLIVVFSALGGTTGSMITGNVFEHSSGQTAFYLLLIPMALVLVLLWRLNQLQKTTKPNI